MEKLKIKRGIPACGELAECGEQKIEEAAAVRTWGGIEAIDDEDIAMISSEFHESDEIARAIALIEQEELQENGESKVTEYSTRICMESSMHSESIPSEMDELPNINLMEELKGIF